MFKIFQQSLLEYGYNVAKPLPVFIDQYRVSFDDPDRGDVSYGPNRDSLKIEKSPKNQQINTHQMDSELLVLISGIGLLSFLQLYRVYPEFAKKPLICVY